MAKSKGSCLIRLVVWNDLGKVEVANHEGMSAAETSAVSERSSASEGLRREKEEGSTHQSDGKSGILGTMMEEEWRRWGRSKEKVCVFGQSALAGSYTSPRFAIRDAGFIRSV